MPSDFRRRRFIEDFEDDTPRRRFREDFEENEFLPSSRSLSQHQRFDLDRPVTRRDLEEFVRELKREGRSEDFISAVKRNPSKARISAATRRYERATRSLEEKPKRRVSAKQRAAARRNIKKALAARRKKRRSRRG